MAQPFAQPLDLFVQHHEQDAHVVDHFAARRQRLFRFLFDATASRFSSLLIMPCQKSAVVVTRSVCILRTSTQMMSGPLAEVMMSASGRCQSQVRTSWYDDRTP